MANVAQELRILRQTQLCRIEADRVLLEFQQVISDFSFGLSVRLERWDGRASPALPSLSRCSSLTSRTASVALNLYSVFVV